MEKELEKTADENGQVTFAAAVFFDDELSFEQKKNLLERAILTTQGNYKRDAAMYLKRLTTPLESEFIRPEKPIETRQTF